MKRIIHTILIMILFLYTGCSAEVNQKSKVNVPFVDTGANVNAWARIPKGKFYKGAHLHVTDIDYDYEIMITDVTNEQYAKYLNEALSKKSIIIKDNAVMGYYPVE